MTDQELVDNLNDFENNYIFDDELIQSERDQQGGVDPPFYTVLSDHRVKNPRFAIETQTVKFELSNVGRDFFQANQQVDRLFDQIYDTYINRARPRISADTKVRLVVFHDLFQNPISTHLISKNQFTANIIKQLFNLYY